MGRLLEGEVGDATVGLVAVGADGDEEEGLAAPIIDAVVEEVADGAFVRLKKWLSKPDHTLFFGVRAK